ncbi:hypothetical protein SEPCBS57363_006659 [Sporothrix epigloea]|uniref:Siderophore iron transporter mirB n=1 Tax=Sporothrix epigloea TaxID=1892477 RepID=A0ABP0E494_9PEZI
MTSRFKSQAIATTAVIAANDNDKPDLDLIHRNEKEIAEHPDSVTENASEGIRKAEAAALLWSKPALYGIFGWILFLFFVIEFQNTLGFQLMYYVYSSFAAAPQITQANMASSIIGGIIGVPLAKMLNVWGRAESMVVFIVMYTVGMIILAACTGPTSYAVGYVLYNQGYTGMYFILNVFVADTSGLYNRAILIGITGTPTYLTALAGPPIVQMFIDNMTWRWAYGAFAIIVPLTCLPLAYILKMYQKKAEEQGIYAPRAKTDRNLRQNLVHFGIEFDVIGALLLSASFLFMFLPFTLKSNTVTMYASARFIVPLVVGVLLFPCFFLWECYGLPRKTGKYYMRWELLKNRTVFGACMLAGITFFNSYAWESYFYYYLMVVYNYSATRVGYATLANGFTAVAIQIVFGLWIRRSKYFKSVCLYFGVPISILGAGLLIRFRSNDYSIGLLVMAQIFIGAGWGVLLLGYELAAYASSDRDGIPILYSLIGLTCSIFSSVASAIVTAIYNKVFPEALLRRLPPDTVGDYMTIFQGGSFIQVTYPVGSPTRDAINYAWGQTQYYLCIMAVAIMVLAFPAVWIWRDHRVDRKQVKGNVI